jgi:hypothetical protein
VIEHHVMANPRNAKSVRIRRASRRQAEELKVEGNVIWGWTDDPRIKDIMDHVAPEQVSYDS